MRFPIGLTFLPLNGEQQSCHRRAARRSMQNQCDGTPRYPQAVQISEREPLIRSEFLTREASWGNLGRVRAIAYFPSPEPMPSRRIFSQSVVRDTSSSFAASARCPCVRFKTCSICLFSAASRTCAREASSFARTFPGGLISGNKSAGINQGPLAKATARSTRLRNSRALPRQGC